MRAMLLCAGFGTRMGGLTNACPKPLLEVNGIPMIDHILGHLAKNGVDRVLINLHFLPESIKSYCGRGAAWNLDIEYSYEVELLGTAGAIKKAEQFFQGEPFLVHYGDILCDENLASLSSFHRRCDATVTLLVHRRESANSVVLVGEDGRVSEFWERPLVRPNVDPRTSWVFSGVCICDPEILTLIPPGCVVDLPRDIFPRLVADRRVYASPLSGRRVAIDSPARLDEARAAVRNGSLAWAGHVPDALHAERAGT